MCVRARTTLRLRAALPCAIPQAAYKGKPLLIGEGDEIAVIVRQYFADRTKEVPLVLNIARVDEAAPSDMRVYLDRAFFAEGARRAFANLDVRRGAQGPGVATRRGSRECGADVGADGGR